jgi:hypothetical protein
MIVYSFPDSGYTHTIFLLMGSYIFSENVPPDFGIDDGVYMNDGEMGSSSSISSEETPYGFGSSGSSVIHTPPPLSLWFFT